MPRSIELPHADGPPYTYTVGEPSTFSPPTTPLTSRIAFAAAHVVSHADHDNSPSAPVVIDWDATLAYRHHLWAHGLSIAEAMDTAQRGMGLDWPATQELIRRALADAKAENGGIACGAGTDHLTDGEAYTLDAITAAYEEQVGFVEGEGGRVILMASRALAATAKTAEDYANVYGKILSQVQQPVILHWLGDMFDPALEGYWGSKDIPAAMDACLSIIEAHADKVDGVKISLLDAAHEVNMRRRLPPSVKMYTGDDFNYPELIMGDNEGYSHALLGIFDAIAPAASAALQALDTGDTARFEEILAPTVPLSRHIFMKPTYYYKTGVVFMAYLNGHQDAFRLVGGLERKRSLPHLAELFTLADKAGLLTDPDAAVARMAAVLQSMAV